ncbi:MAG: CRISPR-associated endonuclease Cas2 [Myxococcales bacterium]|nr:MAG: CRISPR-associated endonuclease Cas2 [Myxococcales bacterium]
MRKLYLVTYDITDAKRLRRVFKKLRGFGDHLQYSVFLCELGDRERVKLAMALDKEIHKRDDQVLIVDLGPAAGRGPECIESLGRAFVHEERTAVVV